jgi:hypothetical protein
LGRSTDEVPILISIGYGVPRSTGRHTNLHTNYDLLVILLVKKMDDDNACGMPNQQPQPPASPAEGDRGSKRQRTGPIGAVLTAMVNAISPPKKTPPQEGDAGAPAQY